MRKVQSILFATDYRPASKEALLVAAKLSRAFGARISVLHVVESDSPAMLVLRKQLSERPQQECLDALAAHEVPVAEASFAFGSPAARIVQKAEERDADIIVIGAGERGGGGQFMTGPVATAIMQRAREPVLAVRPGPPPVEFRNILCPVDFSPVSRRGLKSAVRLARGFGGELVVLTVVPEVSWLGAAVETGMLAGAQEQHTSHWKAEFETFLKQADFAGVRWSRDVRSGAPDREIMLAASEHEADLIVMGTTGRSGLARLMMGSVTQRVVRDLPCSIMTVHDEDLFGEQPDEEDLRVSRLLFAEAEALVRAKSYEPALSKLDQVLVRNPFHVLALQMRADVCETLGEPERARRCRRRAEILQFEVTA